MTPATKEAFGFLTIMKIQLLCINALSYYELDDWEDHQQNATWLVNIYTVFFFKKTTVYVNQLLEQIQQKAQYAGIEGFSENISFVQLKDNNLLLHNMESAVRLSQRQKDFCFFEFGFGFEKTETCN